MIITIIRKPFKGSLVENTRANQCGGININPCRIGTSDVLARPFNAANNDVYGKYQKFGNPVEPSGRWPANVFLSEGCPTQILDSQSGILKAGVAGKKSRAWGAGGDVVLSSTEEGVGWKAYGSEGYADEGGASRFFKVVKE